mgnify:CR=1 FL=1
MQFSVRTLVAVLATAGILAGCSSVPVDGAKTAGTTTTAASTSGSQNGQGVTVDNSAVKTVEVDPLNDPKSPLAQRSVYFALDSYSVAPQYDQMLSAHANYLMSHQNRNIVVEGNTDERGSSEYNLALGQKRSEAVISFLAGKLISKLKLLGVPATRMEAVSFGKEKPLAKGSNEEAWAKNRRADIRYR